MPNILDTARRELEAGGAAAFGAARFGNVLPLVRENARPRIEWGRTIISAAFPYYAGEDENANLSLYARGTDYHAVVGGALDRAVSALKAEFPDIRFERFCDSGVLPEVAAARICGVAATGVNSLAISAEYGSYIFLGFILTDAELPVEYPDAGYCIGCGRCIAACPTGALGRDGVDPALCLSALTQKKGILSPDEEAALRRSPLIWGCDICQQVCPMNEHAKETSIEAFRDKIVRLEYSDLDGLTNREFAAKYPLRAFTWRGVEVLRRNLRIKGG